ncbi:diacylglycerol/lipid kinase family protein [Schaalia suimastitidis]|uniref:diacylglycerol/lipid kinase family protein n=1 Tax=Schaalia suimastitidis TaxID=121163 RepID=UPI00042A0B23|nr:diacylglycerol kinase family protein [Schaalia suimastitidis]
MALAHDESAPTVIEQRILAERRLVLLVSSMSAHGIAVTVGPKVVSTLRRAGWHVDARVTTPDENPEQVAASLGHCCVGALGGDGYLSAVAAGVRRGEGILVPFPGGRGNDLCRALGLGTDPVARAAALGAGDVDAKGDADPHEGVRPRHAIGEDLARRLTRIDALRVTGEDKRARMVLGIVSFGFDACANQVANQTAWIKTGSLAYAYGAVASLRRFRPTPITAIVDGERLDLGGWLTSLSNSGWFGGGINLAPSSSLTDGTMELVHVAPMPLRQAVRVLSKVLVSRGQHPSMVVRPVSRVQIEGPKGMVAMADGDEVAVVPLDIDVEPAAVAVLI